MRAAWVDRHARKGSGPSDHAPVIVDLDEAPDGDIGPVVPPPSNPVTRRGAKKLPQSSRVEWADERAACTTIVPRWEWRTFGRRFGEADRRLAALAPSKEHESEEVYLLSARSPSASRCATA